MANRLRDASVLAKPFGRESLDGLRRYSMRRAQEQGLELRSSKAPRLFGRPRWLYRHALDAEVRYRWSRLTNRRRSGSAISSKPRMRGAASKKGARGQRQGSILEATALDIGFAHSMKVDIAICTWNRSELLAQTLEHLRSLRVPPEVTWGVVVVDNRSTDATAEGTHALKRCCRSGTYSRREPV